MRASRSASRATLLRQAPTLRSVVGGRPSRRAAPSAPIGVFSSWLTLATKSRRTLSTRRNSVMSRDERGRADGDAVAVQRHAAQQQGLAGRAEQQQLALLGDTRTRLLEQLGQALLGQCGTVASGPEAFCGRVAEHFGPALVDHDDTTVERVEGVHEALAIRLRP